jgi:hypothetical protein
MSESVRKMKIQAAGWEKRFANHIYDKDIVCQIYKNPSPESPKVPEKKSHKHNPIRK